MSSLMEDSDDKEKVEIKDLDSLDNVQENHYSVGQKFLSEFIGCFFLLFIGSGVGVYTNGDIVPVVLANGFVVGALIYIFGRISGAHFNPSVSIPMYLAGKITLLELLYYTIAQLSGGFLGSLFVALCNKAKFDKLSSTKIGDYLINYGSDNPDENKDIDFWSYESAFLCEMFLTFLLVMVVFASTVKKNNFNNLTGLIIGVTLIMLIFTGFYLTGGSMNPVRSIPPAVYEAVFGGKTKAIKQIWIYIVAPIVGGILASIVSIYFS
jgi:aquaporin Z